MHLFFGEPPAPLRFLEFQKDHGRHREQERSQQHLSDVDRGVGEKGEWQSPTMKAKQTQNRPRPPTSQTSAIPSGILNGRGTSGFVYRSLISAAKTKKYTMQSSSVVIAGRIQYSELPDGRNTYRSDISAHLAKHYQEKHPDELLRYIG